MSSVPKKKKRKYTVDSCLDVDSSAQMIVQTPNSCGRFFCFLQTNKAQPCSLIHVPGQCATLSQAIARASTQRGPTRIVIASGTYFMPSDTVVVGKNDLVIQGAGSESTHIHKVGYHGKLRISDRTKNVTIEGIHLCCAGTGNGIEILNGSSVVLKSVKISGAGFGVYINGGSNVEIYDSTITNSSCTGVCVDNVGTKCSIFDSCITHNNSHGCFANNRGALVLHNCCVDNNGDINCEAQDNGNILLVGGLISRNK